jgi:hypothetical protein
VSTPPTRGQIDPVDFDPEHHIDVTLFWQR